METQEDRLVALGRIIRANLPARCGTTPVTFCTFKRGRATGFAASDARGYVQAVNTKKGWEIRSLVGLPPTADALGALREIFEYAKGAGAGAPKEEA